MMFLRPVEAFGDIAVFTGTTYPGTVVALEPVDAWVIPAQKVLDLIPRHPDLAMAVIRHLGERVLHYLNLVEDLSLRSVEARLAHTLLQHAELQDGKLVVPRRAWTTFDEMAVRLGTVRDVLSRALKTLEAEHLLRVEKQYFAGVDGLASAAAAERLLFLLPDGSAAAHKGCFFVFMYASPKRPVNSCVSWTDKVSQLNTSKSGSPPHQNHQTPIPIHQQRA
jgi:hypothetical protein